ncbi:MAG: hypothetical protein K1X89_02830 [Myxococcaceae bacterium]|nr:hypothetical protein [Myxococcaceae bacterium]
MMILVLGLLALFGAAPVAAARAGEPSHARVTLQLERRVAAPVEPTPCAPGAVREVFRAQVPPEPARAQAAAYLLNHALLI